MILISKLGADINAKDQKRRTWRDLTESKKIIAIFDNGFQLSNFTY
jgi:hypothetical protein